MDLNAAILAARPGETVGIPPGDYGDLLIRRRLFAEPLTLVSADPANPARFRSIAIKESQGVVLDDLTVAFTPTATTVDSAPVVLIQKSTAVTVRNCRISSGMSVNGVPEDAPKLESNGNVIGRPTCRGISIETSFDVLIEGNELFDLARGVVSLVRGARQTIRRNHIHDLRKTSILGGCDDLTVEDNWLHDNRPWRYGETPVGDHSDYIAIWNGNLTVMRNLKILRNRMESSGPIRTMGGWVQGKAPGIEGFEYVGNVIVGGDHVGFSLSDVRDGLIAENVFVQSNLTPKSQIGMSLSDGTANLTVRDNTLGWIRDKANGATGNVVTGTHLIQLSQASTTKREEPGVRRAVNRRVGD